MRPENGKGKTLWDRLGGEENVKKVVDAWVQASADDPEVDYSRQNTFQPWTSVRVGDPLDATVAKIKRHTVEQIASLTGGPYEYRGKGMVEVHEYMEITHAQFDAVIEHLKKALKDNGVEDLDDTNLLLEVVEGTRKDIVVDKKSDRKS
ncbi:group 1 truncated hemoglobin (plasmid) [Streptomyces goshikiensis]|uniref:group I truncated hemoglobin n=1 Tax=Streptomyces goshikiensis TaxID=1942 RepID=UPI002F90D148|nr:group 1 truncated hemoglobin [Streptomyces goshikiensis]